MLYVWGIKIIAALDIFLLDFIFFIASTEEELKKTRKERDDIRREKDEIIAELQFKIDHMESAYESVLHVCISLEKYTLRENRLDFGGFCGLLPFM